MNRLKRDASVLCNPCIPCTILNYALDLRHTLLLPGGYHVSFDWQLFNRGSK